MHCFACGARMSKNCGSFIAVTEDGQAVFVGEDCHDKIQMAGTSGWQSPKGGPRLWIPGERERRERS